jgi:4-hydroxy-tetrahydrodipicolinate synthase
MQTVSFSHRADGFLQMFGTPIPRLWCPPISHYTAEGSIDTPRMTAHWRTMVDHVGGFLVPGSTGDGWEMDEAEIAKVLAVATRLAKELDTRVLIGVLRTDVDQMLDVIQTTVAQLCAGAQSPDPLTAMAAHNVAGFTICPPRGAKLTQSEIQKAIETILALQLPTAIYQLPQVTENEIAPETFEALAGAYPNFILFKDTSGKDHVPQAALGDHGVFLVRGAEGDYATWLKETGGCYDGLLLSSANGFAVELAEMIALLESNNPDAALHLSNRLSTTVAAAFDAVASIPDGTPFANANKAIDHIRAYGADALGVAPPLLHTGRRLPRAVIQDVIAILTSGGFLPETGYL